MSNQKTSEGEQLFTLQDAAEQIFVEKGLEIDDAEVREEFISDIVKAMSDRIDAEILNQFTSEQQADFDALIDQKPSPDQIQEFIGANTKDLPNVIASAIANVRNSYLAV
jgi:hypothetical protein